MLNQAADISNDATGLNGLDLVQAIINRMQTLKERMKEDESELKSLVVELSDAMRVDHELNHADAVYWGKIF